MNVPDREALIVDGDEDESNDCEQSDIVQVLLNMAFAPREVIKDFVFGPGISTTFRKAMAANVLIDWSLYIDYSVLAKEEDFVGKQAAHPDKV